MSKQYGSDDIEKVLLDKMDIAFKGDYISAITAAMLIYLYPDVACKNEVSLQYESLLASALISKDPEFLIIVSEELQSGKKLSKDLKLSAKFLDRADMLSPFMGAYVAGRKVATYDMDTALLLFKKAGDANHLPSRILHYQILFGRIPFVGKIILFIAQAYTQILFWNIYFQDNDVYNRLWRYADIFGDLEILKFKLPKDRIQLFKDPFLIVNLDEK